MTTITQQLRAALNAVPEKNRYFSGLALRDYYEKIGQFKEVEPIQRGLKVGSSYCDDNFQYRELPKDATQSDAIIWQVTRSNRDFNYFHPIFEKYPHAITKYFANKYVKKFREKGERAANIFFRKTLGAGGIIDERLSLVKSQYHGQKTGLSTGFWREFDKLPEYSRDQILTLAKKIAIYISDSIFDYLKSGVSEDFNLSSIIQHENTPAHDAYHFLVDELKGIKLTAPYYQHYKKRKLTEKEALTAIAKASSFDWWERQLRRRRDQQKEHQLIAAGQVQNKASPYASYSCIAEWREQKKNNREWAKSKVIENPETGEQFELTLQIDKSNANPAIRRCELMTRMRGFEDIADEYGYIGGFITLTAPSKYHAAHSKGGFVENWIGNSPRDTQRYLCGVWAKIRAKLSREDIKYFGFRVAEPHHDGTPHWHILIFMRPAHKEQVKEIMQAYALEVDGTEPGAQENRFKFVDIDKDKGSATGYIAKYISKNIDGYALDDEKDDETGQDLKTMAKAVTAWASRWRIRQFQQLGGAPVTVWRELRRLRDKTVEDEVIDPILAAADVGDWAAYTQLQGGPLVKRKDLKVRASYEDHVNEYDEKQPKVTGIFSPLVGAASYICTRVIKWVISTKKSGESPAWSSVNNCTLKFKNKLYDQREKIRQELTKRQFEYNEHQINYLLAGNKLKYNENLIVKWVNNSLAVIDLRPNSPKYVIFDDKGLGF